MFMERIFSVMNNKNVLKNKQNFRLKKSIVCVHTNIHTNKLIQAYLNTPAKNHINPNDNNPEIFIKKAAGSNSGHFTFN